MLALDGASALFESAGVSATLPSDEPDPGVLLETEARAAVPKFVKAMARHRHYERELDPPMV